MQQLLLSDNWVANRCQIEHIARAYWALGCPLLPDWAMGIPSTTWVLIKVSHQSQVAFANLHNWWMWM